MRAPPRKTSAAHSRIANCPAPQPAGDVAVGNVESERIDTAFLDDKVIIEIIHVIQK